MPLIFIPTDDVNTDATTATAIEDDLYLGIAQVNKTLSYSCRVGNNSGNAVTFTWELEDEFDPDVYEHVSILLGNAFINLDDPITLQAGQCTDTLGLTIDQPIDAGSRYYTPILTAVTTTGQRDSLHLYYDYVGPHSYRRRQWPDSATDFTDNVGNVIDNMSEPLVLHRYDPIYYDPDDTRIFVTTDPYSGERVFETQSDICYRLKPDDERWGYDHNESTILSSFQREDIETRFNFAATNTSMTYNATARLYMPAEVDLIPIWGMFALARGADPAQFKKSVWLTQRQGKVYYLANIISMYRGAELGYHVADLIAIHDTAMGSPDFFNPFAWTYENQSDKPYAMYNCRLGMFITSFLEGDASGSAAPVVEDEPVFTPSTCCDVEGVTITEDYTVADDVQMIRGDASTSDISVYLPVGTDDNRAITIKKISVANVVTLMPTEGQTIDGETSQDLTTQYDSATIVGNETGWDII